MCCTISTNMLLPHQLQTNQGLFNTFSGQKPTPEQASDMLTFREIGTKAVQQYVTYHILQQPSSAQAPLRRRKLLTMSNVKSSRKRNTQKEKEARQVIKCLRRRLAVAIVDAMFMVNTRPLRRTKTIMEYAHVLFAQFAL